MQNEKEIWKDIKGYEGLYQASVFGDVRSLNKKSFKNGKYPYILKGKIMKSNLSKGGYQRLFLNKEGVGKIYFVHQLVVMAFLGHTPCGHKIEVDHIDGNKKK